MINMTAKRCQVKWIAWCGCKHCTRLQLSGKPYPACAKGLGSLRGKNNTTTVVYLSPSLLCLSLPLWLHLLAPEKLSALCNARTGHQAFNWPPPHPSSELDPSPVLRATAWSTQLAHRKPQVPSHHTSRCCACLPAQQHLRWRRDDGEFRFILC